jgi:heterodisulfide reductase subunit A-like polyferredoxin
VVILTDHLRMFVQIQNSRQDKLANMSTVVETGILIVGAGPAGGSLASFLAQNGIQHGIDISKSPSLNEFTGLTALMISSAPGTSDTPRAHLVNPSTIGK